MSTTVPYWSKATTLTFRLSSSRDNGNSIAKVTLLRGLPQRTVSPAVESISARALTKSAVLQSE